jgi:DNA-directed RNA polymerase subunit K/omega
MAEVAEVAKVAKMTEAIKFNHVGSKKTEEEVVVDSDNESVNDTGSDSGIDSGIDSGSDSGSGSGSGSDIDESDDDEESSLISTNGEQDNILEDPVRKMPMLKKFNIPEYEHKFASVHTSAIFHNDDEVQNLSNVYRDSNNIVIDELHKTVPFLTKYERARVLGIRIKQLNSGSDPYKNTDTGNQIDNRNIIDTAIIANKELEEKILPFIIRRPIPGGGFEYWKLSDLELVHF